MTKPVCSCCQQPGNVWHATFSTGSIQLLCKGCHRAHKAAGYCSHLIPAPPPFKGSQGRTDARMQSDAEGFGLFTLTVLVVAGWLAVVWGLWFAFSSGG